MQPNLKGLAAAASTTGLAVAVSASVLVGHPAASASTSSSTTLSNVSLSAFTTTLNHRVHANQRAAHRRLARQRARARQERRDRRLAAKRRHRRLMAEQPSGTPQEMARTLVSQRGWDESQWTCLDELWNRESGWETQAVNAGSGAYGIPQALPGDKMAAAGSDWRTNPLTQIRWGLGYIAADYGSPCGALEHSDETGSY